jgi:protein disulfide-isomerase
LFNVMVYALLSVPAAAQQPGIRWQPDIESAKVQAQQTGRLVLVHFWTPECGPCLALDQNVFNQPGVAAAIEQRFVPVKLNANENVATASGFGIMRVPTDVILTSDGQEIAKLISPPTPAGYVAEVSQVATLYATRAGQTIGQAAVATPAPARLNAAYAGLQVAPNTVPAATAQLNGASPDRYAMPPAVNVAAAGSATSSSVGGAQTNPNGGYVAWSPPPASVPAGNAPVGNGAPAGASSMAASAPIRYNPYGQVDRYGNPPAANPNIGPQNMAAASQSPNTYATPPSAAQMATTASAVAPTVGAAHNAVVAAVAPQSAASGPPDTRALPPGAPPLGFEGYCPVSMRTKWKWVPGDPRWGVMHRGRTYWFVGAAEQQQFLTDPDRFSPALSGMDPVLAFDHRQQVPGKREHSIDYDNIFYMFASEASLQQFAANPDRYAASARQAMGIPRGRLVR